MQHTDQDFQSAHEIGKIYQSITDTKLLCHFFLESVSKFIHSADGFLFLAGRDNYLWLESSSRPDLKDPPKEIETQAYETIRQGKPYIFEKALYLPLVVRNNSIGVAVFTRNGEHGIFVQRDVDLASDFASQMAGALKNSLLFEENLKMERLAAVGQTIGMVVHEIKNIMQLAQLSYEFLERGIRDDNLKFRDRGLDRMKKALREMEGFTWDMLSLTKDYKLEPGKLNMKPLLEELRNDLADKADSWKVRLDFEVQEGFPEVDADERSIYRALLNLVKNAIEASDKPDACIRVRIKSLDEKYYAIWVEDNGQGMTAEVKARIFESFFSTKGRKGTGLGLMIVKKTVLTHGGKLDVESEVGKGTAFKFVLPKRIAASQT